MAEHTPTPWFQDGSYVTDRGDGLIGRSISDCAKSPNIDRATQQANAAFIVKAVNNHEALLQMLEEARLQIEYMQSKFEPTGTGNAVLARIRSTLSDVGGTGQ